MSKYRFKIIPKAKVFELVEKYGHAMLLEITHQSKPCYHLRVNTEKGLLTIARVSKDFLKWFSCDEEIETPFINISQWKIKKYETAPTNP